MLKAGWPVKPACAYMRLMEGMAVRSSFDGFLGQPRNRPSSIPQGCPWSMALLSPATTPWIRMVQDQHAGAVPRVLADDLMVGTFASAAGPESVCNFEDHTAVVQATIDYVSDMGSVLAPAKCVTMADRDELRAMRREHVYDGVGVAFKVLCDLRDLGSH
eukprot:14762283-Alexandrium_andersonii.AAC.1